MKIYKSIISTFLLFLLVFQFKVPFFVNSAYLSIILSVFFINKKSIASIIYLFKRKELYYLFFLFSLPLIYAAFISSSTSNGYEDFSIQKFIYVGPIFVISALIISSIIDSYEISKDKLINLFLLIIIIQAIITLLSFISQDVLNFIQQFQFDFSRERASLYGGTRGLTLSGGLFFSLAITLGFIILFIGIYEYENKNRIYIYLILIMLTLCFMSVGRTIFLGLLLMFLYMLLVKKNRINFFKNILLITFSFFIFVIILSIIWPDILSKFKPIIDRGFEFIYVYQKTGSFGTDSTNVLSEMYFIPDFMTIILGDGVYTGNDGLYYMHTDAGYMRNILLFGFVGLCFFILFDFLILKTISRYFFKNTRLINFMLFSYVLILHGKGEVLGYSFPLHSLMFFIYFYTTLHERKDIL